jgi:hypothetical protein
MPGSKRAEKKLERRRASFKEAQGRKRPGSQNPHKQL